MDPQTLCRLASSCEEARQIDETHYEGTIKGRLGIAAVRAHVRGEVLESCQPRLLRVALQGETLGLSGTFRGIGRLDMDEVAGATRARYALEVSILGRLDTLGKPFLKAVAQRMATKFAGKVSRYLAEEAV